MLTVDCASLCNRKGKPALAHAYEQGTAPNSDALNTLTCAMRQANKATRGVLPGAEPGTSRNLQQHTAQLGQSQGQVGL